jgi:septin family protein
LTDDDYNECVEPIDGWDLERTKKLWEKLNTFGLRFIVVADRWDGPETVEDLKDRYYSVVRQIGEKKQLPEILDSVICKQPYNADYERRRKSQMEKVLLKTKELEQEEQSLIEEAQKLSIKLKKEEKEVKSYDKLMRGEFDCEYWENHPT